MPGVDPFRTSADAYDRFVGRYGPGLAAALVDFAGVDAGMRAVDVGCGPGVLATVLVERLGAGNVKAVEPSEPFVEAARTRLPGVDVVQAAAEELPFPDDFFDAALSQLVVNFMADAEAGVREMARITRAGGIVAACVWDYAGEMTLLRVFWDAAREVDPDRAAAADEGVVMPWCREGDLAELWRAAGLDSVRSEPLVVSARYESFEDLWSPFPTGVGPAGAYCRGSGGRRAASARGRDAPTPRRGGQSVRVDGSCVGRGRDGSRAGSIGRPATQRAAGPRLLRFGRAVSFLDTS